MDLQNLSPMQLRSLANRCLDLAEQKENEEKTRKFFERYFPVSNRVRLDATKLFDYDPRDEVMHGIDGDSYRAELVRQHEQELSKIEDTDDLARFIDVLHNGVLIGTLAEFETDLLTEAEKEKLINGTPRMDGWLDRKLAELKEFYKGEAV